jgi:hypothetical protein
MGARILSLSKDPLLRSSREQVLACAGHTVVSSEWLADVADPPRSFDLLVLCHGYTDPECEAIVRAARSRWPGLVIVFVTPQMAGRELIDAVHTALHLPPLPERVNRKSAN